MSEVRRISVLCWNLCFGEQTLLQIESSNLTIVQISFIGLFFTTIRWFILCGSCSMQVGYNDDLYSNQTRALSMPLPFYISDYSRLYFSHRFGSTTLSLEAAFSTALERILKASTATSRIISAEASCTPCPS